MKRANGCSLTRLITTLTNFQRSGAEADRKQELKYSSRRRCIANGRSLYKSAPTRSGPGALRDFNRRSAMCKSVIVKVVKASKTQGLPEIW